MDLAPTDKTIVALLSGDLPETLTPFKDAAAQVGLSQRGLLSGIERLRRSGVIRRIAAMVDHRKLGFRANAMAVWRIPEGRVQQAARFMICRPSITHCYQRRSHPSWPYNLYAMIHGLTREDCEREAVEIARALEIKEYRLLFSVREFKKAGPAYFRSTKSG